MNYSYRIVKIFCHVNDKHQIAYVIFEDVQIPDVVLDSMLLAPQMSRRGRESG